MDDGERSGKVVANLLAEIWPDTFAQKKPLKINIHLDILASGLPKDQPLTENEISKGLRRITNSIVYKKRLTADASRYDLAGQPVGNVTAEVAEKAQIEWAAMNAKKDAKDAVDRAKKALAAAQIQEQQKQKAEQQQQAEQAEEQRRQQEKTTLSAETKTRGSTQEQPSQRTVEISYRRRRSPVKPEDIP